MRIASFSLDCAIIIYKMVDAISQISKITAKPAPGNGAKLGRAMLAQETENHSKIAKRSVGNSLAKVGYSTIGLFKAIDKAFQAAMKL